MNLGQFTAFGVFALAVAGIVWMRAREHGAEASHSEGGFLVCVTVALAAFLYLAGSV